MQLNATHHPSDVQRHLESLQMPELPQIDPCQFQLAERTSNVLGQNFEVNGRSPTGSIKIGNFYCRTLFDTGSSITIVPQRLLKEIGGTRLPYVTSADGMSGPIKIVANILVDIEVFGHLVRQHECAVIEESPALTGRETDALIGTDLFNKLPPILFNFQAGRVQLVPYDYKSSASATATQHKRRKIESTTPESPDAITEFSSVDQDQTLYSITVDQPTIDSDTTALSEPTIHKTHPLF